MIPWWKDRSRIGKVPARGRLFCVFLLDHSHTGRGIASRLEAIARVTCLTNKPALGPPRVPLSGGESVCFPQPCIVVEPICSVCGNALPWCRERPWLHAGLFSGKVIVSI